MKEHPVANQLGLSVKGQVFSGAWCVDPCQAWHQQGHLPVLPSWCICPGPAVFLSWDLVPQMENMTDTQYMPLLMCMQRNHKLSLWSKRTRRWWSTSYGTLRHRFFIENSRLWSTLWKKKIPDHSFVLSTSLFSPYEHLTQNPESSWRVLAWISVRSFCN